MSLTPEQRREKIEEWCAWIPLTHGQWAQVDPADVDDLMQYTWHARRSEGKSYYAWTSMRTKDGKYRGVAMHQYILRARLGATIDHINHATLCNLKSNLREVTTSENGQNRAGAPRDSLTGIRGLSLIRVQNRDGSTRGLRYRATVTLMGQSYTRTFAFSDEGLMEAAAYVHQKRMEMFPILRSHDPTEPTDSVLHLDCRRRIEDLELAASHREQRHAEEIRLLREQCAQTLDTREKEHQEEMKKVRAERNIESYNQGFYNGRRSVRKESGKDDHAAELQNARKDAWNEGYRASSIDQAAYEQRGRNEATPNPYYATSQPPKE